MQQRAIETRNKILTAAVDVFAAKGLNGATVDDIAAVAGVNKQRLYAYFGSKQGLFDAALLHVFEEVELFSVKTVKEAEKHPEKLTEILLRGFFRVHAAHPAFWRLLSWANLEGMESVTKLDQARKNENEALRRIYDDAIRQGVLKSERFETYLFALLSVSYFCYSNRLTWNRTLNLKFSAGEWEKLLCAEMAQAFSRRSGPLPPELHHERNKQ